MLNLIKRNNRETERSNDQGHHWQSFESWDPFRAMEAMLRWDPFRENRGYLPPGSDYRPQFDVKESADGYLFVADLPGVKESDLDISVTGNVLTISGKREEERRAEDAK